jgi:uncharacterized protein (TIGR03437 family)
MKGLFAFIAAAACAFAADFNTGQATRLVIGQATITAGKSGASRTLVGAVSGLAYANDTLFVADASRIGGATPANNRVLIFKNLSQQLPGLTDPLEYTRRCPICGGVANLVLGQTTFDKTDAALTQAGMRLPTAVATDGKVLAVADTDNNRVLIWKSMPTTHGQAADVVVGQPDFTTGGTSVPPTATSLRGPQGVWIQNGKLYVADTQNHRVLIWNSIPSSNGAAADVVLGQPDFTTFVEPDLTQAKISAKATSLLNPVSVTSDGQRLYVADLGFNRALIWNTLPTSNQAAADVVLGQPDMTSAVANNSSALCASNGKDASGNPTYPARCNGTLSFPRYVLSDGLRVFVADGGNDRVLIYRTVPTRNGEPADIVVGQVGGDINQASDAADSLRTPMSLAWDGTNLYVSDSFNRRITVYTPAEQNVPYGSVRNAASLAVYAIGGITFGGTITENNEVTVKIVDKEYKYKIVKDDTFTNVVQSLVNLINAGSGDPKVLATPNPVVQGIILTSRAPGDAGNSITYSVTTSDQATISFQTAGANLQGGQDAAKVAPGTIVTILGHNLSDTTASSPADVESLPSTLGNTQVYFDGVRAPLFYVSPTQINAQIPWEFLDTTSISAFVRTQHEDGTVSVSTPVAVSMLPQNPGIFTLGGGQDPRPGVVMHASGFARSSIQVAGSIKAGDVATLKIETRTYTYTVKTEDTLESVRDALIKLINQDPKVTASAAGAFTRVVLQAKQPGPSGNGLKYSVSVNTGGTLILSPSNTQLCCAPASPGLVTAANPAVPGETINIYATGLGLPQLSNAAVKKAIHTGGKYHGPVNTPNEFVSSLAGAKTANVIYATLMEGSIGLYEIQLELNTDIPTDPFTQLTIAQSFYVSNIVTFPVKKP